jgi:hypothetical protein
LIFSNCNNDGGSSVKETRTALLVDKAGGWTAATVVVPTETATESSDWEGAFKVSFTATTMSTSGHPTGATAVWPSGGWSFTNDEATVIRRADGVDMTVLELTETTLRVQFVVPDNVQIGGRVQALGGSYTFTLN